MEVRMKWAGNPPEDWMRVGVSLHVTVVVGGLNPGTWNKDTAFRVGPGEVKVTSLWLKKMLCGGFFGCQ